MNIFKRIQEKSQIEKSNFSLIVSGLITGLVALVWISTLPARIGEISLDRKSDAHDESKKGISEIIGDAKNQLGSLSEWKNQLDTQGEVVSDSAMDSVSNDVPVENAPDSALGSLSSGTTNASSSVLAESVPTPATTTSEVVSPEPPPKMILIGTSTTQKLQ
jgi:hypothetical protein